MAGPVEFDFRVLDTFLAKDVDASTGTLTLGHDSGVAEIIFPAPPFPIILEPTDPSAREEVLVTALSGPTATVTRAWTGGSGKQHKVGSPVRLDNLGRFLGRVDSKTRTNNIGTFTSEVDITGMSITWTAIAALHYKMEFHASRCSSDSAGDRVAVYIADNANAHVAAGWSPRLEVVNVAEGPLHCFCDLTGLSGSKTYKVRAERVTGAGNCTIAAAATDPATFLIEAIGL